MAFSLQITGDGFARFERAVEALGSEAKARSAFRKIINRQGALLRKDAVAILPGQTGLKKATIQRALGKPVRASGHALRYILTTRGGFISYKYFDARETRQGVFAKPRGVNTFLPRHFTQGGLFPNRVGLGLGGHVFKAVGGSNAWGRKISKAKSDVRIPEEMVRSDMKRAYERNAKALPPAVHAEIKRLTDGAVT